MRSRFSRRVTMPLRPDRYPMPLPILRRARPSSPSSPSSTARCESTFERFFAAVERDPQAKAKFERGVERLSRTLQILFGNAHQIAIPGLADLGVIDARANHVQ